MYVITFVKYFLLNSEALTVITNLRDILIFLCMIKNPLKNVGYLTLFFHYYNALALAGRGAKVEHYLLNAYKTSEVTRIIII